MHNIFPFILSYRITYDPFGSIKIKITAFDRLGFMLVQRCVVAKDVSVKERHFLDNLIDRTYAHVYVFHRVESSDREYLRKRATGYKKVFHSETSGDRKIHKHTNATVSFRFKQRMLRSLIKQLRRYTNVLKRTEWRLAVYLKVTLTRFASKTVNFTDVASISFATFYTERLEKSARNAPLKLFTTLYSTRRVYSLCSHRLYHEITYKTKKKWNVHPW